MVIGYDQSAPSNSLGLILVETLAKEQLKGRYKVSKLMMGLQ